MSGYLNRAQATADTITADDWLRTGDIGRLDADGYLYIEDRLKDMIITGGENVYGPEVESVLIEHPAIADAAVIGVPDDFWGESVKAIVVTTAEIEPDEIIEFCRAATGRLQMPANRRLRAVTAPQREREDPQNPAAATVLAGPRAQSLSWVSHPAQNSHLSLNVGGIPFCPPHSDNSTCRYEADKNPLPSAAR